MLGRLDNVEVSKQAQAQASEALNRQTGSDPHLAPEVQEVMDPQAAGTSGTSQKRKAVEQEKGGKKSKRTMN